MLRPLALFVLTLAACTAPLAQTPLPTPPTLAESDQFGNAVAVDGDRAVVGAFSSDLAATNGGAAYVYDRQANGTWALMATLTPSDAGAPTKLFGTSVALDGDRLLVGAPSGAGAAFIYDYDGSTWTETARLEAAGNSPIPDFGFAVALDGDRAVVGAYRFVDVATNLRVGAAWVYELSGGTWMRTAELVRTGADATEQGDFGQAVGLVGDRVLVTDPEDGAGGAAYVFDLDGSDWALTATLRPSGASVRFGTSGALDGDRALIGTGDRRAFFAETTDGTSWALTDEFTTPASGRFGRKVALDGDRAVVSGAGENWAGLGATGAVHTYAHNGTRWEATGVLTPDSPVPDSEYGAAVALSGTQIVVGAQATPDGTTTSAGAAFTLEAAFATDAEEALQVGTLGLDVLAPNPVRAGGVAHLAVRVPLPQRVRVTISDALGRAVAVAHDAVVAGEAAVELDTQGLAPGLYVVRVQTGTATAVRTLSVVR